MYSLIGCSIYSFFNERCIMYKLHSYTPPQAVIFVTIRKLSMVKSGQKVERQPLLCKRWGVWETNLCSRSCCWQFG